MVVKNRDLSKNIEIYKAKIKTYFEDIYMPTKIHKEEIYGLLIGIVCCYSWIFMIMDLKMKFFSTDLVTNGTTITIAYNWGQVDNWLEAGIIPLFLIAGHYFASSKVISENKKVKEIIGMKSSLLGFFIWLIVTITTFLLEINMSYKITLAGGYITIVLIYLFMKININRRLE